MSARFAFLAVGFIAAAPAWATDFSGQIALGAIRSDNIRLAPVNTESDTIDVATTDFLLHEQTRRLEADIAANLQYLSYSHDVYPNQLVGDLTGYGKFALVPSRIDWVVQDNFGQQQLNPGTPVTPLNLENINYLSTGPDVSVPFGPDVHAQLAARYSKVTYQLHDLDDNRADGSVALVHPLSANTNVSVNASVERVNYEDSTVNPDFTTRLGYLHYDAQGARSKLTLDAGYNDATIMGTKTGGALVRADATRAVSSSSSLELSVGQDISNTGSLLRQLQGSGNVSVGAAALQRSDDPFTSRYASAAWRFERHRTGLDVALSQFRETHTVQDFLNRTRTQIDVGARRNLSSALTLSAAATYAREAFVNATTPDDTYTRATLDLAWHLGRRVELHAQYSRIDYRSDSALNMYTENRFMLTAGLATGNRTGIPASNPIR